MLPTDRTSLRFAARIVIAAMGAHLVGIAIGLPGALWAVMTALFVVQMSVGGTIGAGVDRIVGTLVGAVIGGAAALTHQLKPEIPLALLLLAALTPVSLFAVKRPSYRIAPVTAALMLLIVNGMGQPLAMAVDRVVEIVIGCVVGVAVSILVLPHRAEQQLVDRVAAGLRLMARLVTALLEPRDPANMSTLADLNEQLRALMVTCESIATDVSREHRLHLGGRRDPEPLFRTLRRLRSDMAIVDRAMVQLTEADALPPLAQLQRIAAAIAGFLDAAADGLEPRTAPPPLDEIDAAMKACFGARPVKRLMPLSFAIAALRRDCSDLHDRMAERAAE